MDLEKPTNTLTQLKKKYARDQPKSLAISGKALSARLSGDWIVYKS